MTDQLRSARASKRREETAAARALPSELVAPAADVPAPGDDTLMLLALCCRPGLTPASQIALTLRADGGLPMAEIARAFLVPESTMAQRITRAKQKIKASSTRFTVPPVEAAMVTLNQAVAVAMVDGPVAGLALLQDVG